MGLLYILDILAISDATQFLSVAKKLHGEHFFALALDDTAKNRYINIYIELYVCAI